MNDKNVSISLRVKEERKRLGYTQEEIAGLCEVSRVQWGRYERGETELGGRVLKAFSDLGASAKYILTGDKSKTVFVGKVGVGGSNSKPNELSDDEWEMIQMYRKMHQYKKDNLLNTAKIFSKESGYVELGVSVSLILSMILLHIAKVAEITLPNLGVAIGCISIFTYIIALVLFLILNKLSRGRRI